MPFQNSAYISFLLSPRSPHSFHEAPSTEAKEDLTDQGRELHKGINNLGKRHSQTRRLSALFHLLNSLFYRAIKIFPWLHIQLCFLCQGYACAPTSVVLKSARLTSQASVENVQHLMLNTLWPCQPEFTLQIKFDYRQIIFLTRMFYELKYFLITLCSWKRISGFIICYFPGLLVFKQHSNCARGITWYFYSCSLRRVLDQRKHNRRKVQLIENSIKHFCFK